MTYDKKCAALAQSFVDDYKDQCTPEEIARIDSHVPRLAKEIQTCIEDFINHDEDFNEPHPSMSAPATVSARQERTHRDATWIHCSQGGLWECVDCKEVYCSPPWTKEKMLADKCSGPTDTRKAP